MSVLASSPSAPKYGVQLCEATGLGAGTVYPLLSRLLSEGLIADVAPPPGAQTSGPGRPRVWYQLTKRGEACARESSFPKLTYLPFALCSG